MLTLHTRVLLVMAFWGVVWLAAVTWGAHRFGLNRFVWTAVVAAAIYFSVNRIIQPAVGKLYEADIHEDLATVRSQCAELATISMLHPGIKRLVDSIPLMLLLVEEKYSEALPQLQERVRQRMRPRSKEFVRNNPAWCLAQMGDTAQAIDISESVLREVRRQQISDLLPAALGTLGTAYCLAGRPAEAVDKTLNGYERGRRNAAFAGVAGLLPRRESSGHGKGQGGANCIPNCLPGASGGPIWKARQVSVAEPFYKLISS